MSGGTEHAGEERINLVAAVTWWRDYAVNGHIPESPYPAMTYGVPYPPPGVKPRAFTEPLEAEAAQVPGTGVDSREGRKPGSGTKAARHGGDSSGSVNAPMQPQEWAEYEHARAEALQEALESERREAFHKTDCANGPDEYGNYPCDPKVIYGGGFAECQVCGRVAKWGVEP